MIAMAEEGGFLNAPDVYMDKIAVGGNLPDNIVDLDETVENNLRNLAKAKGADRPTWWSASSTGRATPS